ncbi:conserved hypothetical protein [Vibrio crassostreae]|nr:hypothetical protein EDB45_1401 [Vibrio crassostreae]CAK2249947.1 conserved hypothetical protein [Vibrio crassostreae]CAK2251437.1 conserved hypothetical protein [Vibrio crassostreae]CAK3179687.1 conserved hypothetical protein [Vibrio crassostreae]CAK3212049.1 conserved hypothetical protein [Vibrio crassostreae]
MSFVMNINMDMYSMFENESKMQEWLVSELEGLDGLNDLISNSDYLDSYEADSEEASKVISSFSKCAKSLNILELISEDENISIERPDSLRPDFLFYSAESQGVVIVELKNISGPTREVGTELSAYSCEVRSYIPYLSEGDLFHVIISNHWPTLMRHYIFHEIFWNQKNIICLQPKNTDDGIKLEIISIDSILEANVGFSISERHLAGYQLCLYDNNLYDRSADRSRLDSHIEQMKTAIQVMSSEGHRQRSSGFAFLWKDHLEISLAPYSISIFNMAPFKSIERFLHEVSSLDDLTEMQMRFLKLTQWHAPTGHGDALQNISDSGEPFLRKFCSPRLEGFHEWIDYKPMMLDRAELLSFHCWGIFEEMRNIVLKEEYDRGNLCLKVDDPQLGLEVINRIINDEYEFIEVGYLDLEPYS